MENSTMVLAADGTFAATLGCNLAGGTWSLDGDRLELLPVDITERACTEMEQTIEDHVLAVLGDVGFEVDGPRLTLTGDDGVGVIYRVAGDPAEY
jgi:heat shock protein HslJ